MAFEGLTKKEVAADIRSKARSDRQKLEMGVVEGGVVGLVSWAALEAVGVEVFRVNPASLAGGVMLIGARRGSARQKGRRIGFAVGSIAPEMADRAVDFLSDSELFAGVRQSLGGLIGGDQAPATTTPPSTGGRLPPPPVRPTGEIAPAPDPSPEMRGPLGNGAAGNGAAGGAGGGLSQEALDQLVGLAGQLGAAGLGALGNLVDNAQEDEGSSPSPEEV